MIKITIDGIDFFKTQMSRGRFSCVGIAKKDGAILVTNTFTKPKPIAFSILEWKLFIDAVKNGEFDSFLEE